MSLSIIRTKKDKNNPYVIINKKALENSNLSAKAKGIFTYLMSKPDDWKIYISELANHFKNGRESIANGINELINAGYITKKRIHTNLGKFDGWDYTIFESPYSLPKAGNPITVKPKTVKPKTGNQTLLINDLKLINDHKLNNKKTNIIIPDHLKDIWLEYNQHRIEIKKKLTPTATKRLLSKLLKFSPEIQIKMVEQSIANSWIGIFPIKDYSPKNGSQSPSITLQTNRYLKQKVREGKL